MNISISFNLPNEEPELKEVISGPDSIYIFRSLDFAISEAVNHGRGELGECHTDTLLAIKDWVRERIEDHGIPVNLTV